MLWEIINQSVGNEECQRTRIVICNSVVKIGLVEKAIAEQRLGGETMRLSSWGEKPFQAEGLAHAKALRWQHTYHTPGQCDHESQSKEKDSRRGRWWAAER